MLNKIYKLFCCCISISLS